MPACKHAELSFVPSDNANVVGFKQPGKKQLRNAAVLGARAGSEVKDTSPSTFPAPLVLPGDELSWEPDSTADDVQTWKDGYWRNEVTPERRIIYLAATPSFRKGAGHADGWARPQTKTKSKAAAPTIVSPDPGHVLEYLRAFYHPLPVKLLTNPQFEFVEWESGARGKPKSSPQRIGLDIGDVAIGIRHRKSKDGLFTGQLNLNDLLDAAMAILPKDAYALLMLVDHDLYEDEEDDFCCGRAYGGSRVAVVSMARYHPSLDAQQEIERTHGWPASHCHEYMENCCREVEDEPGPKKARKGTRKTTDLGPATSALHAAVQAHSSLSIPRSSQALANLWLGRVCKTASHELGHCFGIDHCTYYACIMQGTAGLVEDARQPPYLCPIDLAKVLYATGADETARYRAMLAFCEKFGEDRLFSSFGAWLRIRLKEAES